MNVMTTPGEVHRFVSGFWSEFAPQKIMVASERFRFGGSLEFFRGEL